MYIWKVPLSLSLSLSLLLSLSLILCVCDYPTVFYSGGPNKKKSVQSTDLIKREWMEC